MGERPKNRIGGPDMPPTKNQIAGLYDLEETLGEGHYAVVKLARHVFTGEKVAVKVIDKMKLDAATRVQMLQEVRLMKLVQHPYVVRLYEVIDTQTKLYLILEFADGGDMYDHIMRHEDKGLGEDQARKYFRQIVTAIQYCHQLHVVHRDLKPENVVFFEKLGMVKLTDFGFSNKFNPGQRLQTSCGSLAYSAPEILLGDAYDAPAVDIWSLGVILYMLVCGSAPFQEANDSETLTMIMDCNYTFPTHLSPLCKDLISRMLQRQPEHRASLEDIAHDPWLHAGATDDAQLAEHLPLVSRQHLTEEEHAQILQRMVNGGVAAREDIIEALDRDDYNHITATYFLLAERRLRVQRHAIARKISNRGSPPKMDKKKEEAQSAGGQPIRGHRPSSTVDSLLSPPSEKGSSVPQPPRSRIRKCSIVEEEEDEAADEEEDRRQRKSHHSSTSSLADPNTILGSPVLEMMREAIGVLEQAEGPRAAGSVTPPAPFPVSSQIGTGGLSRQGSLRRSGESSSPASERKSIPGSPTTPPGSSTPSNQSSPARFKMSIPNRKLVTTRSSPQLVQAGPVLNQIHEEAEEGAATEASGERADQFPSSVAVIRRLEQRRRLHKSRTASCSSSEASDDDSESRRKRGTHDHKPRNPHVRRDSQHDDSSDNNQEPGMGSGGAGQGAGAGAERSRGTGGGGDTGGGSKGGKGAGHTEAEHGRRHRPLHHTHSTRLRQSHSLNRISEMHTEEEDCVNNNVTVSVTNAATRPRQFTPQLSSESDSDCSSSGPGQAATATCDMLTRYLDSLRPAPILSRSRDDSLNSSDGELDGDVTRGSSSGRSRHKVNLRLLEQRLNKIQEECNKSAGEEEDMTDEEDEVDIGSIADDDPEDDQPEMSGPDILPDISQTILDIKNMKNLSFLHDNDDKASVKSCDVMILRRHRHLSTNNRTGCFTKKPLHRAHSCGSLLSLKERVLIPTNFWDLFAAEARPDLQAMDGSASDLTLTLTAANNPITVLQLQTNTSRCCSLC